jgi:molybdopterin/thiamine biosynthesis adenylyltransferase
LYLAAAGVGTLVIIDDDRVDASNLQRQVLHATDRIGVAKVDSAARALGALNPDVTVIGHRARLTSDNALELLGGCQVIVDGSDNFATRYLVNDAALRLGVPVVHASIWRFEGRLRRVGLRPRRRLPPGHRAHRVPRHRRRRPGDRPRSARHLRRALR